MTFAFHNVPDIQTTNQISRYHANFHIEVILFVVHISLVVELWKNHYSSKVDIDTKKT